MAEIPAIKRRLLAQGVDVIDLGAGDADFAPPAVAIDTLARAVRGARLVDFNVAYGLTAPDAPRECLARAVEFCRRHGIVIAYDNPYCEITFDGYVAPSIFELAGAREVAVEFHSLSKTFCMTG